MNVRDALTMLRRYWVSIVGFTLIGLAIAATTTLNYQPTYVASTAMSVRVTPAGFDPDDLANAANYAEMEVARLTAIASTPAVLQPVIDRLGLPETSPAAVAPMVNADNISTDELQIKVSSSDRDLSARLTREIGNELVRNVATRSPNNEAGAPVVVASFVTPATAPDAPVADDMNLTLLVGALVGLALGMIQAALRGALDIKVRTEGDVIRATHRDVIAEIPFDSRLARGRVGVLDDPRSPVAEAHRRLRTNLLFAATGGPTHAFVVTSAVAGEGKSTTAIGIASALADAGESVLLIDADLRTPRVAESLGLQQAVGLTTVLSGDSTLAEAVQRTGARRLDVLTDGGTPANPAELLGSEAMKELLEGTVGTYDYVVLDTPAVLPVTDATVLAALCRGAIVVAGSATVTAPQLQDAVAAVERVNATVLGIALNKTRRRGARSRHARDESGIADAASATIVPARSSATTRATAPGDVLADR